MSDLAKYDWCPQPEAAALVRGLLDDLIRLSAPAQRLSSRLQDETGTRLFDWLDHLALPFGKLAAGSLNTLGFTETEVGSLRVWEHPLAILPRLVEHGRDTTRLAVGVDAVVDFLAAHRLPMVADIVGEPGASCRAICFERDREIELWAVERHGDRNFDPLAAAPVSLAHLLEHREAFQLRARRFDNAADGFQHAQKLIIAANNELGANRACDLFFAAEREYWQRRNGAARIQKARQDRLGLGWANHDHHTYRSSREHFHRLVAALEQLGFTCRERFYAGKEAGWGAQVLEQTDCGITVFADVDLAEDEVLGDFAHEPLAPRDDLGTVGLWCKLHGEAFLEAGMHHLECQFDFDAARSQLAEAGMETMAPFTDFPHLRQAFTVGEMWPVAPERIADALEHGWIDQQQADRFAAEGALGSHLEILERNDGYKGFNQTGISDIIKKTDPRRVV